jgi:hypothetical protein
LIAALVHETCHTVVFVEEVEHAFEFSYGVIDEFNCVVVLVLARFIFDEFEFDDAIVGHRFVGGARSVGFAHACW